tara:strand:+ start:787 stop:1059 length:273 start_codon:yes stop_codon:yes gene_type:complete
MGKKRKENDKDFILIVKEEGLKTWQNRRGENYFNYDAEILINEVLLNLINDYLRHIYSYKSQIEITQELIDILQHDLKYLQDKALKNLKK